jgi:hypothetical protein
MPAIKPEDWGRIYAFIWKDVQSGGAGGYKEKFERDPASAIKEIAQALPIDYSYDRLFDVDDPPGEFSDKELNDIISGKNKNFKFFLNISC